MPDLVAIRGDTNLYNIVVMRQNQVIDLDGAKLWFTVKANESDADDDAIISLNSEAAGILILSPTTEGKAQIQIPPSATAAITDESTFYYDVQLKESTNVVTTVAFGTIKIQEDITRTTV